jgi:hypothetical protein
LRGSLIAKTTLLSISKKGEKEGLGQYQNFLAIATICFGFANRQKGEIVVLNNFLYLSICKTTLEFNHLLVRLFRNYESSKRIKELEEKTRDIQAI